MIEFILPLPETTNRLYKTGRGHWYKSQKQKDWEEEAGMIVRLLWGGRKPIHGPLKVELTLMLRRERDIDGSIKPILDLLQNMRVYENDRQIIQLHVYKFLSKETWNITVRINEM